MPTAAELALFSSASQQVTFLSGEKASVTVRVLPLKDIRLLLDVTDDPAARIGLYVNQPAEWVEALDSESIDKLLEVGDDANFPRLEVVLKASKRLEKVFRSELETLGKAGSGSSRPSPERPV